MRHFILYVEAIQQYILGCGEALAHISKEKAAEIIGRETLDHEISITFAEADGVKCWLFSQDGRLEY